MSTRSGDVLEIGGSGGSPSGRSTFSTFVLTCPLTRVVTIVVGGGNVEAENFPIGGPDEIDTAPEPPLPRTRSTAPTTWLSPVSRLIHEIGLRKSIAMVRLVPRGEPSAFFMR